jgi:hypothetical protein
MIFQSLKVIVPPQLFVSPAAMKATPVVVGDLHRHFADLLDERRPLVEDLHLHHL